MSTKMSLYDETRVRILDALTKKKAVKPNLKQIKNLTGFHKATVKGSLDFLEKKGLVTGYGPKINFRELGYKLETTTLMQADFSKKKTFSEFLNRVEADEHTYWCSGMLASGKWNLITRGLYADVESYRKHSEEFYYEKIPKLYDFIKDRQIFFTTEPIYKSASRTSSIIKIIKKDRGL